jgi:hypothetical protein
MLRISLSDRDFICPATGEGHNDTSGEWVFIACSEELICESVFRIW